MGDVFVRALCCYIPVLRQPDSMSGNFFSKVWGTIVRNPPKQMNTYYLKRLKRVFAFLMVPEAYVPNLGVMLFKCGLKFLFSRNLRTGRTVFI